MLNEGGRLVMDVTPWPAGRGFSGGSAWWSYIRGKSEAQRLDNLMGLALLDESICQQLLANPEPLLKEFELSEETCAWFRSLKANNLTELAEAMVAALRTAPSTLASSVLPAA